MTEIPPACLQALQAHLNPEIFRALCDPTRLSLLAWLATCCEPRNVSQVSDGTGVGLSGVSRHLAQLKRAGVVVAERRGREVLYRLDAPTFVGALRGLADAIEDCCRATGCCGFPSTDGAD